MKPFRWWIRLRYAALAGLAGWLLGLIATIPFEVAVAWRYVNGHASHLPWTLAEGMAVWGCFTLFMAVAAWAPFVVPVALLVPPSWFVRWRRIVLPAGAIAGLLLMGLRLQLFDRSHFINFETFVGVFLIAPNVFAFAFALGLTWAYIRLAARRLKLASSS